VSILSFDFDEYGLTVGLTSLGRLGAHYLRVWPWSRTTQNLTFHLKMNAMAYKVFRTLGWGRKVCKVLYTFSFHAKTFSSERI
jgi:hypothetical protein